MTNEVNCAFPQGLKPGLFASLSGTAKAVPYPKPIYEMVWFLGTENWELRTENYFPTCRYRKHSIAWSFTIPAACMNA